MPRKLTSKQYDALSQRLERMADGIAKHKSEQDFPKRLDTAVRRQWRQGLEDLRSRYEDLISEAARAYDAYAEEFKRLSAELSKDDDTLRGYYGKSNPEVGDFGSKVIAKPSGGRKPKANPSGT
jgi:hypothetical protein